MKTAIAFPPRLAAALEPGGAGLLVTVAPDGWPHVAFTWVAARMPAQLRVAVDSPSTSLSNLQVNARAAVQYIGPHNLLFLLMGTARVSGYHDLPPGLRVAIVEMAVEHFKDQSWPLVAVDALRYTWTDPRMVEAERAVLRLLTGRPGE